MYSNTIQARIEATLKELYKTHDTVFKPAVMYAMYSNIRAYFIVLDMIKPYLMRIVGLYF